MLYTLSIPVVDYRIFLNLETHRLDVAQFPRNWNDNSFLRGFGRFDVRVNPSREIPFSEKKYANANNGLRIISLRKNMRRRSDAVPSSVFRRIFFDTYCARFDIGLKNISKEARKREGLFSFRDITSTIASFVDASIYSPSFSKQGNVPFHKIGEYLLAEYLYATTIKPRENLSNDSKNWMAVGCPVIVVEALEDDFLYTYAPEIYRFKRFVGIPEEWGIELFYRTITRNNIPVYVLIRNRNAQKEKVRALRINLLKYHQERETLSAVMKLVAREDRHLSHINVQALGKYLDNVTSLYSRKTRDGIQQSTVFEIIRAVESQINNDEYSIMLRLLLDDERLSFLRKRFPKTIEKLYNLPPYVMMGGAEGNNTAITNDDSTVVEINSNADERRCAMNKKVFISHSTIDKEFANRLVLFLKAIGIPEKQIICTSRYGNGVPLNTDIYDYIRDELRMETYVLFILSKNYYDSVACLNEMGAAWVTMKKSTALLLPGFKFQEIKGAIDPRKISIKLDDERNQVIYYLSELRDALQEEFGLNSITEAEWMHSCHDLLQDIIDGK